MAKKVTIYDINYCGLNIPEYWSEPSRPEWAADLAVGTGYTPALALVDALDSLAQRGWDVENLPINLPSENDPEDEEVLDHDWELNHYVTVFVY